MKKFQPEPEHSDGTHIAWVLLGGLTIALTLFLLFPKNAKAIVTGSVIPLDVQISLGTDSSNYAIDSVVFRGFYRRANNPRWNWLGKGAKCVINTQSDNSTNITDSLCWYVEVPIDSFLSYNADYGWLHQIAAWVYWDARGIDRVEIDVPIVVRSVYLVDSLQQDCGGAGGGGGNCGGTGLNQVRLYARDTTNNVNVPGMELQVYASDLVTLEGQAVTNATGYFDFSLNDGTYYVRANTGPLYIMETANDTVVVSGATQDTVEIYAFSPMLPGTSDSITLVVYLPGPEWNAKVTPMPRAEGTRDTSGILIVPYPVYGKPDVNGIAQVKVLRSEACNPEMPYEIVVFRVSDKRQLLKIPEYTTPNSTSATVDW